MLRNVSVSALLMTLLLSPNTSYAQPTDFSESDAVEIEKTEPAPFSGILMKKELAVELSVGAEACLKSKIEELEQARQLCYLDRQKVLLSFGTKLRASDLKLKVAIKMLEEELKPDPFWQRPGFLVPVSAVGGIIVGAAAVLTGAWALGQAQR